MDFVLFLVFGVCFDVVLYCFCPDVKLIKKPIAQLQDMFWVLSGSGSVLGIITSKLSTAQRGFFAVWKCWILPQIVQAECNARWWYWIITRQVVSAVAGSHTHSGQWSNHRKPRPDHATITQPPQVGATGGRRRLGIYKVTAGVIAVISWQTHYYRVNQLLVLKIPKPLLCNFTNIKPPCLLSSQFPN